MAHFDCKYEDKICILTPKEEVNGAEMIAHIKSVVDWLTLKEKEEKINSITPCHYEFSSVIKLERMIPLNEENLSELLDEKMLLDFLEQATNIAGKLSAAKIHHNDLKPSNFVYQLTPTKERKYFVIDFGQSQVFNADQVEQSWKPTNSYLLDEEFCRDFGYEDKFNPEYNYCNLLWSLRELQFAKSCTREKWRKIKLLVRKFFSSVISEKQIYLSPLFRGWDLPG